MIDAFSAWCENEMYIIWDRNSSGSVEFAGKQQSKMFAIPFNIIELKSVPMDIVEYTHAHFSVFQKNMK